MSTASRSRVSYCCVIFLAVIAAGVPAFAQTTDVIGVRAQGMAGAFTAVADDSTAGWWNPAGLAGGAFFSATLELSHPDRSTGETTKGITVAYPALGISYYRLPVSQIRVSTSTASPAADREDHGDLSLYGVTFGQSIGEHLVIGSTAKLLSAGEWHAGLDIGAMASFGIARLGLTVHDITEPTFGTGADAFTLKRHARAGVSVGSGKRGVIGTATLAFDADLTRSETIRGDERNVAVGAEVWTSNKSLGLRGGVAKNTVGNGGTLLSGGVSVIVKKGTFVDAQLSGGPDDARRGWGLALRVTF